MACLPCSKLSHKDVNVVSYYKKLHKEKGVETYFYRLKQGGDLFITRKESFNTLFLELIKPNFINGSEYFHISEFKE